MDGAEADDSHLLVDIARSILARVAGGDWTVEPGDFWCVLTPLSQEKRPQGWKLHVSATMLAAPVVLSRVAEVLIRDGCAFKFARGFTQLTELLSGRCPRGSGGKFITAYPADDEQFRRLAATLDRVTDGLPGPVILSDRQLRPGSSVFYRYGVFAGTSDLNNDGLFESKLVGPDGQREKDQRLAWFSPPRWAVPPWPEHVAADPPAAAPGVPDGSTAVHPPVLIGDRFVVRAAIKQSYKGGIYRATDQRTGAEVIVKKARPHAQSHFSGTDARDLLRHEAEILDLLGPLGLTPQKVALFSYQEFLFLAEERMPGVTLRRWVSERAKEDWRAEGAPVAEAVEKARRLVELMAALHGQGLVLRDFTPNNIMVTPDDRLRLVDLEHAAAVGSKVRHAYTPGYAAAEQISAPSFGPGPSQLSDLFSLGATIFYLASGTDPLLLADDPVQRSQHGRFAELVAAIGVRMAAVHRLAPLVLGLTHDEPDRRWSLARAAEFLARLNLAGVSPAPGDDKLSAPLVERLLADGISHIVRTMTPADSRLWKTDTKFSGSTDPCAVQYGAAGVLGVLTRSAQVRGGNHLHDGVTTAATWIERRLFDIPRVLPGLYTGRAGTAWSLYEAARFLDDDKMAAQAIELARQLPVEWPNPDIFHGAAGAGMTQLYLWRATGDPEFKRRGSQAADCVLRSARERAGQLMWPIPATFDSDLAGQEDYGFAHGVAGAGAFLLYAALATDRPEYLEAARRAADTLQSVANVEGEAAWWPVRGEKGSSRSRRLHWCSGSSGVGTFLIRLWLITREQPLLDLAVAAGAAIRREKWYSSTATCHGLAGDGDFLLDLANFTGEQRFRDWAAELAAVMYARHAIKDGLKVLPDNFGDDVTISYSNGLGGVVGFLLRLHHGGLRQWMPDELLPAAQLETSSQATPAPLAGMVPRETPSDHSQEPDERR